MSVTLISVTKNTRGAGSHSVTYNAIGKEVTKDIKKRIKGDDGKFIVDANGDFTYEAEKVTEIESDGVVTSLDDAMELCGGNLQIVLDDFAVGFNKRAYSAESGKDELDELVSILPEAQRDAMKRSIRAFAKAMNLDVLAAAEKILSLQ